MRDIPHIRLVDAHSKGNRGDQAEVFLFQKGILVGVSDRPVHAGMIGQRPDPLVVEPAGNLLDLGARQAIDDAARSLVARQEAQKLLARLVPLDDLIGDVRTVEGGGEDLCLVQPQAGNDVFPRMRIGRRR
jgi:hypothetical protein